jgi:hypothetical protein
VARNTSRELKEKLLEWYNEGPSRWKWYYCQEEDIMYAKEGMIWREYTQYTRHLSRTSPRQGRSKYSKTTQLARVTPAGLRLASVVKQGHLIIYQGAGSLMTRKRAKPQAVVESFEQVRQRRPSLDKWAIQEIIVTDEGEAMAQAIKNGTAIAVSDGSYKDGRGTAAFILEISDNFDEKGRIVGVNSIPGEKEDQSSYRGEIGGVSGIVETVDITCSRHSITSGAVKFGLDGEQAMKHIFGSWPLMHPKQADYDLLKDLWQKIKQSPITWSGTWVKGHQDDDIKFEDLDRWGQLNVESDGIAKDYWNACTESNTWQTN